MRKVLIFLTIFLTVTGCTFLNNSPIGVTEDLLKKYQTVDEEVVKQLNVILENTDYTDDQKDKYKEIMKEQYRCLSYEIKDDYVDGNNAYVDVEITVKDFYKVIKDAEEYFNLNKDEFESDDYIVKLNDYKLEKLKEAKEKVSYTIRIFLSKQNNNWQIQELDRDTLDKISGIYAY